MNGAFIAFEGIDGCGKTSQIDFLRDRLHSLGKRVLVVREPGGTPLGEEIRHVVLHMDLEIGSRSELLLYTASRAQLTEEIILPALKDGVCVIADRFADSSVAYQGYGRQLPVDKVMRINEFAIQQRYPDLSILLDISVEESISRLNHKELDRLESEDLQFRKRVRQGYLELSARFSERYAVMDGMRDRYELHEDIYNLLLYRKLLK